ncbi:MAG TPA: hypothetical protein VF123_10850 [Candidatus Sulfotelmatobacter sp.]
MTDQTSRTFLKQAAPGTANGPVELGYRSALAIHMANLSYRHKKRMTLEEAKSIQPEYS